jgi:catechol 2,3-dioxygenase-like lactoylglutathione lyase family enzyme
MPFVLLRCYAVTLNTKDWRKTRDFYVNALGLPVLAEQENISLTLDVAGMPITFEVFYKKPDSYAELYIEADDVPHFCARLRAAGHDVPREWHDRAELFDLDGRRIILTQAR